MTEELHSNTQHEALKNAAEQFVAAYADGNVSTLLEYFEDILKDALATPEGEAA